LGNHIAIREDLARRSRAVLGAIKQRWLKLRIDHVLPLADAGNAHRMLEGRQTMGKIVLKVVD
jgi:NADPH2:quinone reductase